MKKLDVSKEQFEAIKKAYLTDLMTMKNMELELGMSCDFIVRVLREWGMFIPFPSGLDGVKKGDKTKEYNRLRKAKLDENITYENKSIRSIFKEGQKYYAICRTTGKKFEDYHNSSGVLIRHLKSIMPGIQIPTGYKKRRYEKENGRPWHSLYFDFTENNEASMPQYKCAHCDWKTYDILNSSGQYTVHLRKEHGLSASKHVSMCPQEEGLFSTAIMLEERGSRFDGSSYEDDFVHCMVCNEKMRYVTNTHLKKHRMTSWEYKLKYPMSLSCSNVFRARMKKQLSDAQINAAPKWVSKPEGDLRDFVAGIGLEFEGSNRSLLKGIEVDIVISSLKVGIEFNGNRYHSELYGKKGRMHHLEKTMKMNEIGFGMVQIFEDEWEERNEQVKSKLMRMLSCDNGVRVNARDCDVIMVDSATKNEFMNKYHIQGEDRSSIHYGLVNDDDVVAIMTFDPHRNMTKAKEGEYELKRFATKDGLIVRGGAGKLLTAFIRELKPKSIISFADRRWTLDPSNNMYTSIGFRFDGATNPEYHYYNNKLHRLKRWNKFQFGKSSIAKKFPHIYSPEKTEWQMMQEAGFDRIWDCGKFRYVMNLTQ